MEPGCDMGSDARRPRAGSTSSDTTTCGSGTICRDLWGRHQPILEGWSLVNAWAMATESVLGPPVGANTFRHPAIVAKAAVTLDPISGRVALSAVVVLVVSWSSWSMNGVIPTMVVLPFLALAVLPMMTFVWTYIRRPRPPWRRGTGRPRHPARSGSDPKNQAKSRVGPKYQANKPGSSQAK
jgi:hypothetical protein